MSTIRPDEELILAAYEISSAAPEMWRKFIAAFDRMTMVEASRLISAPPEHVYTQQGRARMVSELSDKLRDCRETASKIIESKRTERRT